jgi:PKD repeat protein
VNAAPTARITNRSCTNLVCSFDGSTSTDPDPDTLTYSWDFGDGTPAATTSNPTHTYATAGEKTVTLTVDDGNGHSDDDSTTFTVTAPPPVNAAPTAAITNASCTDLACSFTGSTSSDPDGDTLTYSWDFGDGSAAVTTTNASHTYATAGARTVTLTVDDGQGHTDSDSVTANPTEPDPDPASNIAYVGSSSTNGNRVTHAAPIPGGVNLGDTLVVFFTANTTNPTYTPPAGWTQLESANGNGIVTRAWTRAATAADLEPNARVVVTSSSYAKSDITVAAYRGTDGTSPIATSASRLDNASGAAHTSPAVTATDDASWLVTYWADKSSDTTGWTAPGGQSVRQAVPTTSSSGHITALLTDSNGPVASGARGQLTATANSTSSRGASFSVLLKSS